MTTTTMTTAACFLRRKKAGSSRTNLESERRVGATGLVCFSSVCIFLCCLQRPFLFIVSCATFCLFVFCLETWCYSTNRSMPMSFSAFYCVLNTSVFAFLDIFIYEFRATVLCFSPASLCVGRRMRSSISSHVIGMIYTLDGRRQEKVGWALPRSSYVIRSRTRMTQTLRIE